MKCVISISLQRNQHYFDVDTRNGRTWPVGRDVRTTGENTVFLVDFYAAGFASYWVKLSFNSITFIEYAYF